MSDQFKTGQPPYDPVDADGVEQMPLPPDIKRRRWLSTANDIADFAIPFVEACALVVVAVFLLSLLFSGNPGAALIFMVLASVVYCVVIMAKEL